MKTLDLDRYVLNQDYSVWPIDFALSASFEIPLVRLQAALPAGIQPVEPRPGVGLFNVTVFHFTADTWGLSEPCSEVVASAHVLPNLRLAPMLPKSSMFTFRLGASTREFIDSRFASDAYPVYPAPVDVRIDRDRIAVDVRDEAGQPIVSLARADGAAPRYEDERFYVQSSAARDGRLWMAGNLFDFRRAENQRALHTAGSPVPHAFFDPVDLTGIGPRQGQIQMWLEPGSVGRETHFFLTPVG